MADNSPTFPLLTYRQAADLMSCSTHTVMRLAQQGKIERIYLTSRAPRIITASIYILFEGGDNGCGTAAGADPKGECAWQKSTNAVSRRSGGQISRVQLDKELDALLA